MGEGGEYIVNKAGKGSPIKLPIIAGMRLYYG